MAPQNSRILYKFLIAVQIAAFLVGHAGARTIPEVPALNTSQIYALELPPAVESQLQAAIAQRDYVAAEKILLAEIAHSPKSARQARLLNFAGGVYFLDHDYLNAAIAWNKSNTITPLPALLKFSLSMTYIRLGHPAWADKVLQSLAAQYPTDALYPYWLGRIAYDAKAYDAAILYFRKSIALAPGMARAYDNLGLCYFYRNQNSLAIENYHKAIELDRSSQHPSAWPYLNLAIASQFTNNFSDAELNLRKAIQIDPGMAVAHFQLGNILEASGQTTAAIHELREAVRLKDDYAEPHIALARIYRRLGDASMARKEVQAYLSVHRRSLSSPPSVDSFDP